MELINEEKQENMESFTTNLTNGSQNQSDTELNETSNEQSDQGQ